jgi:Calcineurin-like phosphoesterase
VKALVAGLAVALSGCGVGAIDDDGGALEADAGVAAADAGSFSCTPCLETSECGAGAACVQYAGNDYCGHLCYTQAHCASDELCVPTVAEDGTMLSACVPANGTCGETGCGLCAPGTTCDLIAGECVTPDDPDAGDDEETDAGDVDAGFVDAGRPDGGRVDAGPPPGIGADGGEVPRFIFAVLGDTRPPANNDTAHYPTARVTRIFDQIQALNPRPQFVVATGDYMFASPTGTQGPIQMDKYIAARNHFKGPLFGSLGNHECQGGVAGNCAPASANNNNYEAWFDGVVRPLGKTKPYYDIPFEDTNGHWKAKLLIVACNAWNTAQKNWLQTALARRTDYTFVARHEPMGSTAPCNADMDAMLKAPGTRYTMLLVGHVHNYAHSGKQLIEGVGGAPLTGSANFGFATIEQRLDGGVRVRQYDSTTNAVVSTYTLPAN